MTHERLRLFRSVAMERLVGLESLWGGACQMTRDELRGLQRHTHTLRAETRFMGFDELACLLDGFESIFALLEHDGHVWSEELARVGAEAWKLARDAMVDGGTDSRAIEAASLALRQAARGARNGEVAPEPDVPWPLNTTSDVLQRFRSAGRAHVSVPMERLLRSAIQLAGFGARLGNGGAAEGIPSTRLAAGTQTESASRLTRALSRLNRDIEELCHHHERHHLVTLRDLFSGFERSTRILAQELHKEVYFESHIAQLGVNQPVAAALHGVAVHLIHNALDHGVELPHLRKAAGKSEVGCVVMEAFERDGACVLTVQDDGAGIDLGALTEGDDPKESLQAPDREHRLFAHGVTSRETPSCVSGRGIGLAAVRRSVEELGGEVTFYSARRFGARFTVTIPLPVARQSVWKVNTREARYALPSSSVLVVGREAAVALPDTAQKDPPHALDVETAAGQGQGKRAVPAGFSIMFDTCFGPVAVLSPCEPVEGDAWLLGASRSQSPHQGPRNAYLPKVGWTRWMSAEAVEGVVRERLKRWERPARGLHRVLVVEDSALVRDMLSALIAREGLEVITARSAEEALGVLATHPDIGLMVTDLQLPGLEGAVLVGSVSKRLPVVVLSMGHDVLHQQRVRAAGAVAYFSKEGFSIQALRPWLEPLLRGPTRSS